MLFRSCGSCYAIAAAHQLSTIFAVLTESKNRLNRKAISPQLMMDCVKHEPNSGCCGGNTHWIYKSVTQFFSEDDYPYIYSDHEENCTTEVCNYDTSKAVLEKTYYDYISEELSWEDVKRLIKEYNGFVTNMYAPDSLSFYTGGIYSPQECAYTNDINHAVVVDGYGECNGIRYLWVRNSWGNDWGIENGHFKISFDRSCQINTKRSIFYLIKAKLTTYGENLPISGKGYKDNEDPVGCVLVDGISLGVSVGLALLISLLI